MLNNKMLKANNKACLKYKYQLKEITLRRKKSIATENKCIIWKMGLTF